MDPHDGYDRWLSLSEASSLLGVHASTLRRWADSGRVPCQRTPGGHRRFNRRQLMPLLEGSGYDEAEERDPGEPSEQDWHRSFADRADMSGMREIGQRLSGVLVQYVLRSDRDARYLTEARKLGVQYARASKQAGVGLLDAVRAFVYFRSTQSELMASAGGSDAATCAAICGRFEEVTAEVLLGLVSEYEDAG